MLLTAGRLSTDGRVAYFIAISAIVLWVGVARRSGQAINLWWNLGIFPTTDDHSILEGSNTGPLLEKYTYHEKIKTVIDEDQLPELPHLLEEIGLGDRLQARTSLHGEKNNSEMASYPRCICW